MMGKALGRRPQRERRERRDRRERESGKTASFFRRPPSELSAIEGIGGAPGFVFGCFFLKILAFVSVGFAFSDTDLDFYSLVLPVQPESDEG